MILLPNNYVKDYIFYYFDSVENFLNTIYLEENCKFYITYNRYFNVRLKYEFKNILKDYSKYYLYYIYTSKPLNKDNILFNNASDYSDKISIKSFNDYMYLIPPENYFNEEFMMDKLLS